jgi:hypothetical protein
MFVPPRSCTLVADLLKIVAICGRPAIFRNNFPVAAKRLAVAEAAAGSGYFPQPK